MSTFKNIRMFTSIIEGEGLRVIRVEHSGKHLRFITTQPGCDRLIPIIAPVAGKSTSPRLPQNFRMCVRRALSTRKENTPCQQ